METVFPKENHYLMDMDNQTILNQLGFTYIANFYASMLKFDNIDLAINTLSFAEMEIPQVLTYCKLIKEALSNDGVLFEQNFNTSPNAPKNLFNIIQSVFKDSKLIESNIIQKLEKGIPHVWSV